MSVINVQKSKRGKDIIIIDGFQFCINRRSDDDVYYWCCACKKNKQCTSTLTTKFDENYGHTVIKNMNDHSHSPCATLADSIAFKNKIKTAALTSSDKPTQLIQNLQETLPSTSACSLPNKNALRQIIHRARKKATPIEPTTIDEINVPEDYREVQGEQFLAVDTRYGANDSHRLLIFCTKQSLMILRHSIIWLMDGTFRTCPGIFTQIYSIHALVGHDHNSRKIIPVVYCLLMDKREESYMVFLQELRSYAAKFDFDLNPQHIITDFEIAMINVIRIQFPDTNQHACIFHLGQNIYRHIQQSGLASRYGNDSDFAVRIRHLIALAYLPPEDIPAAFDEVKKTVLQEEETEPILDWFEIYYVLGKLHSHVEGTKVFLTRSPPLFSPSLWSIHRQNELGLPRSQNSVQAWHRRWNSLLNNNRNGVYATVKHFIKEQITTKHNIERAQASIEKTPPKKVRKTKAIVMQRICQNRTKMTTLEILRAIAHNTEL